MNDVSKCESNWATPAPHGFENNPTWKGKLSATLAKKLLENAYNLPILGD
jgi:hypothetical protein